MSASRDDFLTDDEFAHHTRYIKDWIGGGAVPTDRLRDQLQRWAEWAGCDLRARAEKAEQERDELRQENNRLSIKLTVSEQDVEHWSARAEKNKRQLRSLLDFAERHQLSHADHDHDCYELWCIERDYSRTLIEDAP